MRTLYFDCFAGASGDMILGALIDAGVESDALVAELSKMDLPKFEIAVERTNRAGIAGTKAEVKVPHEHVHRGLSDILGIIEKSDLSDALKRRSIEIFRRLAEAEARVHGTEVEKIHFHEVGAMDSVIDIVGCCIGFEMLGIERFAASKLNVGSGFVVMEHGRFPVPPPAVAELLKGIPFYSDKIEGELVTPTGAAIISTVCDSYGQIPEIQGEVIGYGAGSRQYSNFPNVLRVFVGETASQPVSDAKIDRLAILETNLDDLAPQIAGYVMERAFEIGALDCWFTPVFMKKNRPGVVMSILCREEQRVKLSEMLFRETSTLGIRCRDVDRTSLDRRSVTVSTRFGEINVKLGLLNSVVVNVMPEYDDVRALARKHGVPFADVRDAALEALRQVGDRLATHA